MLSLCVVVVQVLGKWAEHRTASIFDDAEDVAKYGSLLIRWLVNDDNRALWLDTGADKVLRAIVEDPGSSSGAKQSAGFALDVLGLW